jgi:hypothetical protein
MWTVRHSMTLGFALAALLWQAPAHANGRGGGGARGGGGGASHAGVAPRGSAHFSGAFHAATPASTGGWTTSGRAAGWGSRGGWGSNDHRPGFGGFRPSNSGWWRGDNRWGGWGRGYSYGGRVWWPRWWAGAWGWSLYAPYYVYAPASSSYGYYWYFCQSANAYYPDVQACPEGWQLMPAE